MSASIETKEPSILARFQNIWMGLGDVLCALPRWEQCFHVFWLLGPFIMLIERSPADIWLSGLVVAFLIRSKLQGDWAWLRVLWVKACLLFLAVCLLSSAMSVLPTYAFSEALAWFRFPLFAMATAFWLGKDKRLLYPMLLSTAFGMLLMTGILIAEFFIEGQSGGRLSWPYGDLVSGNYLTKVGLPAFTIMVALIIGAKPRLASIMAGLFAVTLVSSILTGERINFLLRICSGFLAVVAWRLNWSRCIILISFSFLLTCAVFEALPKSQERFTSYMLEQLPDEFFSDMPMSSQDTPRGLISGYYQVMGAGLSVFETAPFFGVGPAAHRELCPSILTNPGLRCDNHPHNFYIQMLAETGLVGLITGSVMILSIIWAAFAGWRKNRDNVVAATAFVVPFGLFFPIQSTGDFFGQWNNIFMWSAIALALAAARTLTAAQKK